MRYLKTNTAVIVTVGPFYDKTDGVTIETALTITNERITLIADTDAGSAPTVVLDNIAGATSGTSNDLNYITGNDAGFMQLELAAADVNRLGRLFLSITDAANHVPVFHEFTILPAVIYDSMILGTDLFDVSVTQWLGTAAATPTVAGVPEVDMTHLSGVAQSATDLKDFADDGYDPATNKVQGVVLTDTLTTYTSNTPQTGDAFSRLGAPAGASVSVDIAAIEAQTDDIGAAGAGLTAIGSVGSVTGAVGSVTGNVGGNVVGSVASVTAGVTLAASAVQAIWDALTTALTTAGSIGKRLADFITGDAFVRLGAPVGASISADVAAVKAQAVTINADTDDMQTRLPAALVGGRIDASVGAMAANVMTAAAAAADLTTELQAGLAMSAALVTAQADLDDIQARLPAALVAGRIDASVGAMAANTLTASALAADAVTEIQAGLSTYAGGDTPGTTTLLVRIPGTVQPQTGDSFARLGAPAGASLSVDIAAIESQTDDIGVAGAGLTALASAADLVTVAGYLDTEIVAIKAKTDQLTFTLAGKVDSSIQAAGDFAQAAADKVWASAARTLTSFGTLTADVADKLLGRSIAGSADGGRTVQSALRLLRNRREIAAGVLTVYVEDDVTPDWTGAVATAAGNPVSSIDP